MPNPLSMDLRERIIAARRAGQSLRAVARRLSVSPSSVSKLGTRLAQTGELAPKARVGRPGHGPLEPHKEVILRLAGAGEGRSREEIAALLYETKGVKVTGRSISRALNRWGYSYKKNAEGH